MLGYRSAVTFLSEVLPVLATIGLLGLWLYQQNAIEQRSGELRKLAAARTVYQVYQSHNALFNSLLQTAKDGSAQAQIRRFQMYNYELGLSDIEKALPDEMRRNIPPPENPYTSEVPIDQQIDVVQKRLEILQDRLLARENDIRSSTESAKRLAVRGYVALSTIGIAGAILKAMEKLV